MVHSATSAPLLIKQARIARPEGIGPAQDILIRDGKIAAIGDNLSVETVVEVWDFPNAHVSAGWCDVGVHACDPGLEHREDLDSVAAAAAAGGFTAIAVFPNSLPAMHSKSEVLYVRNKTASAPISCYPIGAISNDCAGKDLAELYDLHRAGAVAFSDGQHPVQDAGLLLRAMQYATAFEGLVLNHPHHKTIAANGQMHEGLVSTSLGLRGIPALAEELMVQRDLSLLAYTPDSRLHVHLVSTVKSVALVRAAKQAGLKVTASVAIANLCFTDQQLGGTDLTPPFDSNWKVLPPLRTAADVAALREGISDGTIDFICSNHTPWDEEAKNLEFSYAEFGINGLETLYPMYQTWLSNTLSLAAFIEKIAIAPRMVLGLPVPEIQTGATASLTVFDPALRWTPQRSTLQSKSANSPLLGQELSGKVLGIVHHR